MRLLYRFRLEGLMPQRALLRMKRAGIPLYNLQKTEKNVILFQVEKKDVSKVFAIYPNVCYNSNGYHPYRVTCLGGKGVAKWIDFCKRRAGVLLGALAFAVCTLAADGLVLGVDVVGSTAYARECKIALAESGIKPYAFYVKGKEDIVTAKLLTLPGAEFCSVKKIGNRVRVELRCSPLHVDRLQKESMRAARTGKLLSLTVLRGTPLKKEGEEVREGEPIVGNWFTAQEGEEITVEPIARARIACAYEGIHTAESKQQAFAQGYLALNLSAEDEIVQWEGEETEEGFRIKITFVVVQTVNL